MVRKFKPRYSDDVDKECRHCRMEKQKRIRVKLRKVEVKPGHDPVKRRRKL